MTNLRSPYPHKLNASGTACADGTDKADGLPCPACKWADEHCALCGKRTNLMYMCDLTMQIYCAYCFPATTCGEGLHEEGCETMIIEGDENVEG